MTLKSKSIAYFSLPILVILIASIQMYRVETSNYSRWKRGGFGMYTSINEVNTVIVINDKILSEDDFDPKSDYKASKLNFIYTQNQKNLEAFLAILNIRNEVKKIQLYSPVFNSETHQLSYKVSYEQNFE